MIFENRQIHSRYLKRFQTRPQNLSEGCKSVGQYISGASFRGREDAAAGYFTKAPVSALKNPQ